MDNYAAGATVRKSFNTHVNSVAATLEGSPEVVVYKDDGTTESNAGVTLTVDHDGITGRHRIAIDTSEDGTFYSAGSDFEIVLSVGEVDGNDVAGTVLGSFSLDNRISGLPDGEITAAKIADGAITADKVPNLDAAVSTRSTFNPASDAVTLSNTSRDAVADAVWDEPKTSHTAANTFGKDWQDVPSDITGIANAVNGFAEHYTEELAELLADKMARIPDEGTVATAEDVQANGSGIPQISSDRPTRDTTFYLGAEGHESRNIVTLNAWSSGTVTLAYDLTEVLRQAQTTLLTVNSVTVVKVGGSPSITTSNLRKDRTLMVALWDTAAISTANAGTYTVTVNYTTVDNVTKVVTGTLEVE